MPKSTVSDLTSFADRLRGRGLTVTPDQVADMTTSITLIDPASRDQMYAALRCLSVTDQVHRRVFDEEFRRFFDGHARSRPEEEPQQRLAAVTEHKPIVQTMPEEMVEDAISQTGASAVENVAARDFADLDDNDLAEAKRMVSQMFWRPSDFRTRRWHPEKAGPRPDLRRTLHGAVGPEGDLMAIQVKARKTKQRPLIVLADISGSMERYAEMFLVFAHAAQQKIDHVEVFTFSTKLTRITPDLEKRDPKVALTRVSGTVKDWSGGTKIGEALQTWNKEWSRRLARGRPIALILSDGWDCGEPDLLATEMSRLARSVHSVIWLNPLAARADYQPATRGMKAVLPYIDHLLPAASVSDLRGVIRLLETIDR